eukprot:UN01769
MLPRSSFVCLLVAGFASCQNQQTDIIRQLQGSGASQNDQNQPIPGTAPTGRSASAAARLPATATRLPATARIPAATATGISAAAGFPTTATAGISTAATAGVSPDRVLLLPQQQAAPPAGPGAAQIKGILR